MSAVNERRLNVFDLSFSTNQSVLIVATASLVVCLALLFYLRELWQGSAPEVVTILLMSGKSGAAFAFGSLILPGCLAVWSLSTQETNAAMVWGLIIALVVVIILQVIALRKVRNAFLSAPSVIWKPSEFRKGRKGRKILWFRW